jgi:hypothetical protein
MKPAAFENHGRTAGDPPKEVFFMKHFFVTENRRLSTGLPILLELCALGTAPAAVMVTAAMKAARLPLKKTGHPAM